MHQSACTFEGSAAPHQWVAAPQTLPPQALVPPGVPALPAKPSGGGSWARCQGDQHYCLSHSSTEKECVSTCPRRPRSR